jgi:hypothetical protein
METMVIIYMKYNQSFKTNLALIPIDRITKAQEGCKIFFNHETIRILGEDINLTYQRDEIVSFRAEVV